MKTLLAPVVFVLACIAPTVGLAADSYDSCDGHYIETLPAIITTQGTWCLRKDLATSVASGNAITVSTNNVNIDCNGFKLGGLSAGAGTTAVGISATSRSGVTVRNCNIRGFNVGVRLTSGANALVEDNNFTGNTGIAVYTMSSDGVIVRNNVITDTGGSTNSVVVYAIVSDVDTGVVISDNIVNGVSPNNPGSVDAEARGIYTSGFGAAVTGNRVSSIVGNHSAHGIVLGNDGKAVGNLLDQIVTSGGGNAAILCRPNAIAKDNLVSNATVAFNGCLDAGGNYPAIP